MGCDIHPYPEKLENRKWITAEPFKLSDWWSDTIDYEDGTDEDADDKFSSMSEEEALAKYGNDPRVYWAGPWDDDYSLRSRNYTLFGILADVRNYSNNVKPIDLPRGLPNDVSFEVKRQSDQEGLDGHSHSWFTLRELLAYDWDTQKINYREYVTPNGYKEYKKNGRASWNGYHRHSEIGIEISNGEMSAVCNGIYKNLDENEIYYTEVRWSETLRDVAGRDSVNGILDKLASYGEPDEVRLVFWFDN